jgi:hypothetical protein
MALHAMAQTTFIDTYNRTYKTNGDGLSADCIDVLTEGDYIVGASSFSLPCNPDLFRINKYGQVLWDTTEICSDGGSWFTYVEHTDDGGFIAVDDPGRIFKFSSTNALQWIRNTNCASPQEGSLQSKLVKTSDGYVLTGLANSKATGLRKIDFNGNAVFGKEYAIYGPSKYCAGLGIQQTKDGGYIISGVATPYGSKNVATLIKTDSNGNYQWGKTYALPDSNEYGMDILVAPDGGYFIDFSEWLPSNVSVLHTDSLGNIKWAKKYVMPAGSSTSLNMTYSADNKIILDGWGGETNTAFFIMKLDTGGTCMWLRGYLNLPAIDIQSVIRLTPDNGFIAGLGVYGTPLICVIKTDSAGGIAGSCADSICSLPVMQVITPTITSTSYPNTDTVTYKTVPTSITLSTDTMLRSIYCPGSVLSVAPVSQPTICASIYPNPAHDIATLDYQLPKGETGLVDIYSMAGQKVASYPLKQGEKLSFSTASFSPGVYLYQIVINGTAQFTDRLVIVR